jgi:hypothetical protein
MTAIPSTTAYVLLSGGFVMHLMPFMVRGCKPLPGPKRLTKAFKADTGCVVWLYVVTV